MNHNNNNILSDNYDNQNIFAKILRQELPAKIVFEDEFCIAFEDINPKAKVHILIIPKKPYINLVHMMNDEDFFMKFMCSVKKAISAINPTNKDFRLLTNNGKNAGQEVFHMHFHVLID